MNLFIQSETIKKLLQESDHAKQINATMLSNQERINRILDVEISELANDAKLTEAEYRSKHAHLESLAKRLVDANRLLKSRIDDIAIEIGKANNLTLKAKTSASKAASLESIQQKASAISLQESPPLFSQNNGETTKESQKIQATLPRAVTGLPTFAQNQQSDVVGIHDFIELLENKLSVVISDDSHHRAYLIAQVGVLHAKWIKAHTNEQDEWESVKTKFIEKFLGP